MYDKFRLLVYLTNQSELIVSIVSPHKQAPFFGDCVGGVSPRINLQNGVLLFEEIDFLRELLFVCVIVTELSELIAPPSIEGSISVQSQYVIGASSDLCDFGLNHDQVRLSSIGLCDGLPAECFALKAKGIQAPRGRKDECITETAGQAHDVNIFGAEVELLYDVNFFLVFERLGWRCLIKGCAPNFRRLHSCKFAI